MHSSEMRTIHAAPDRLLQPGKTSVTLQASASLKNDEPGSPNEPPPMTKSPSVAPRLVRNEGAHPLT